MVVEAKEKVEVKVRYHSVVETDSSEGGHDHTAAQKAPRSLSPPSTSTGVSKLDPQEMSAARSHLERGIADLQHGTLIGLATETNKPMQGPVTHLHPLNT